MLNHDFLDQIRSETSLKYCANTGNDLQEQAIKFDFNVVRNENAITFISIFCSVPLHTS